MSKIDEMFSNDRPIEKIDVSDLAKAIEANREAMRPMREKFEKITHDVQDKLADQGIHSIKIL